MDNPLRSLARLFVTPCDERPQPAKKFIAGTNIEYEREIISSFTGKIIAYEKANEEWVTISEAQPLKCGTYKFEKDEELDTIKALFGWKM